MWVFWCDEIKTEILYLGFQMAVFQSALYGAKTHLMLPWQHHTHSCQNLMEHGWSKIQGILQEKMLQSKETLKWDTFQLSAGQYSQTQSQNNKN